MSKETMIVKKEKKSEIITYGTDDTIETDVASEMRKGYDLVLDVIEKLKLDTRVEKIKDESGETIGRRTYIHPQLLSWAREGRMFLDSMWKLGGGEMRQEVEKKALETKAKLILEMAKADPEKFNEALEQWKQSQ